MRKIIEEMNTVKHSMSLLNDRLIDLRSSLSEFAPFSIGNIIEGNDKYCYNGRKFTVMHIKCTPTGYLFSGPIIKTCGQTGLAKVLHHTSYEDALTIYERKMERKNEAS